MQDLHSWKVFSSDDPAKMIVNFDNYKDVINVFKTKHRLGPAIKEAESYLLSQHDHQKDVRTFCRYMVEYLKKQQIELTGKKFKTAAQWVTEILQEILKTQSDDKSNSKTIKKITYAIDKLNSKRSLYQIDNQVNFSSDEEEQEPEPGFIGQEPAQVRKPRGIVNSSYRRRHSV